MNKFGKSVTKYSGQEGRKRINNHEEASIKKNMKIDTGNDSPQHSYESCIYGHSTPIRRKDYAPDVEDSPELDYHCSPISLPCTQDGGNEISWDWQTPSTKTSSEKFKSKNSHVQTPKRSKHLQKKRNSNSPLLPKPLKRKQVKMENIENIGKLTAELKALTEKMKNIQENCNNDVIPDRNDTEYESDSKLLIEFDTEINNDIMIEIVDNDKSKISEVIMNNNNKKGSSYEDLFDDSIDDSMVRCSQEIEEKLNLCKNKGSEELSTIREEKETVSICFTSNSTDNSKSFNMSKNSSTDTSGKLKTYSNNSSKTSSTSSFSFSSLKSTSLQKRACKNNVTHTPGGKLQEKDLSDFPDDSFDDCLATCIEDDKLLTKLSEYDFNISNSGCNSNHSKKISKETPSNNLQASSNAMDAVYNKKFNNCNNSKLITDDLVDEVEVITDTETIQKSFPGKTALENRKFFKTKSLSDQCFYQNRNCNLNSKTSKTSNSIASTQKRFQPNSNNSSVSTTYPVVPSQNSYKVNNFASINGMENAPAFDRLKGKEDGNCIVKYSSTSNLSNIKEVVKESQSVQCTPAEIERKRLEAKMKLEAKRKLQQSGQMTRAVSEVPRKKSVKR
nr:PREDICTED: dentin sialophosphoprotein-like [Megachile rotundata]